MLDLLADAAAWHYGRGIAQWPPRFPTNSVRAQIAVGEALLVEEVHHPVATLAVAEDDDELWGSDTAPACWLSAAPRVSRPNYSRRASR